MTTILVIEDEQSVRDNLIELLAEEGFAALGAEDGRLGLKTALEKPVDLIICDIMLPELDGFGVFRELQQHSHTRTIPFIFLTALSDRTHMRLGMNLGADDYLTKPFSLAEVLEAVNSRLARREVLRQQQQEAIDALEHRRLYLDSLTNLPNRFSLREHFNHMTCTAQVAEVALITINLDHFGRVTAGLGSEAGDQVIRLVAQRLSSDLPPGCILAHLQADEFLALFPVQNGQDEAIRQAQSLLHSFNQPYQAPGQELFLSASLGISFYPQDGTEIDDLVRKSLVANRAARKRGGNACQVFLPSLEARTSNQIELETDLRRSIERNELRVYYQPRIDLATGRLLGAEALVRWQRPAGGLALAGEFVPLLEEVGFMPVIDDWVLKNVLAQLRDWLAQGLPALRVSVNLTSHEIDRSDFVDNLSLLLERSSLDPNNLELELTESVLMRDPVQAALKLNLVRSLGIQISVDDFGTGYSSLSQLSRLPFSILKIDRSFVQNVRSGLENETLLKTIIQLGHDLGLRVVAEGIETAADVEFLRCLGCDEGQGFFFSPPQPADVFESYLRNPPENPLGERPCTDAAG